LGSHKQPRSVYESGTDQFVSVEVDKRRTYSSGLVVPLIWHRLDAMNGKRIR